MVLHIEQVSTLQAAAAPVVVVAHQNSELVALQILKEEIVVGVVDDNSFEVWGPNGGLVAAFVVSEGMNPALLGEEEEVLLLMVHKWGASNYVGVTQRNLVAVVVVVPAVER